MDFAALIWPHPNSLSNGEGLMDLHLYSWQQPVVNCCGAYCALHNSGAGAGAYLRSK